MAKEIQYVGATGQTLKASVIAPDGKIWDVVAGTFQTANASLTNRTIALTEVHPGFYSADWTWVNDYPFYSVVVYNGSNAFVTSGVVKQDDSSGCKESL